MGRTALTTTLAATLTLAHTATTHAHPVQWHHAGASIFGNPCEYGNTGYRGDNLNTDWRSFAELNMGTAMGGLPYRTKIRVLYPATHRRMTIRKLDIGGGGSNVNGLLRAIDLRQPVARYLAGAGCNWTGRILWRRLP